MDIRKCACLMKDGFQGTLVAINVVKMCTMDYAARYLGRTEIIRRLSHTVTRTRYLKSLAQWSAGECNFFT